MLIFNHELLENSFKPEQFSVYNTIPFAIIISDLQGQILFVNDAGTNFELFAKPKPYAEITLDYLHKINPAKWQNNKDKALKKGETVFHGKIGTAEIGVNKFEIYVKKLLIGDKEFLLNILRDISKDVSEKTIANQQIAHYQTIFDSVPALIFVKDIENRILNINKTIEEIGNFEVEHTIGKNLYDLLEDHELAEKNWRDDLEVIETGLPKRNIIEPFYRDKSRWFLTDKIPYRDASGKITGVIGFSIDITERKNVEDALVRSEKKFRQLFDTSPDGIIISNLKGEFISANNAFLHLTGYAEDEIAHLSFAIITPTEDKPVENDFIEKSMTSGMESQIYTKYYLHKDKTTKIPVRINCWIIKNEAGKPIQLGVYVKDISIELRAVELENSLLEKEKAELKRNLDYQTQQLSMKVTQLIEKSELANHIISQLSEIETNDETIAKRIRNLIFDIKTSSSDDFWIEFETTFGQINQSFYERLSEAYPNITKNDRKISAFLRMNLSTKDIANITHQSIRSIEMARSRLRKKLKLSRSENISTFLSKF
jgi:PAS domain S-box-containing protein